jgi:hypothetical protein
LQVTPALNLSALGAAPDTQSRDSGTMMMMMIFVFFFGATTTSEAESQFVVLEAGKTPKHIS